MTRYSQKTNDLAASAVLEAAVAEAVRLLRCAPVPEQPGGWLAVMRVGHLATAEDTLLAAGRAADLLLGRAS